MRIAEAFEVKKKELGEVPFKNTKITDPHIKEIILHTAKTTGVPAGDIAVHILGKVKYLENLKQYSPILYETMSKNAIEKAAFDLIGESTKLHKALGIKQNEVSDVGAPAYRKIEFDPVIFNKLVKAVQKEHSQFFPLRAPNDKEYIFAINPILVPSNKPEFKKFNSVGTAAATKNGEFIFNVPFMQQLLDYATVEKLQPKGKKYQNNGGTFPPQYSYIEFLIMHELLHYSYGDFDQGMRYKQFSHKEHNWASDFRSNYMLVKSGYDQLPIGLFSDHINYDRQGSYRDIVQLVHDELAKLPKKLKDETEKNLDDSTDEHEEGDPGGEGGPGEPADPDEVQKEIERKMGGRKGEEPGEGEGEDGEGSGKGKGKAGQPGGAGSMTLQDVDSQIKPKFNWKTLLAKCVSSANPQTIDTYQKPARRAVTGMHIAAQIGSSAIKPGEKTFADEKFKLVFVLDTSGSMGDAIARVGSELKGLMKAHGKNLNASFGVMYFAGEAQYFDVNIGKNYYARIKDFSELGKSETAKQVKGYLGVFNKQDGGGTVFSAAMASELASVETQGYNVMIFSDSDLAYGDNLKSLKSLYEHDPRRTFFIADGKQSFVQICKEFKFTPGTFSHF